MMLLLGLNIPLFFSFLRPSERSHAKLTQAQQQSRIVPSGIKTS